MVFATFLAILDVTKMEEDSNLPTPFLAFQCLCFCSDKWGEYNWEVAESNWYQYDQSPHAQQCRLIPHSGVKLGTCSITCTRVKGGKGETKSAEERQPFPSQESLEPQRT